MAPASLPNPNTPASLTKPRLSPWACLPMPTAMPSFILGLTGWGWGSLTLGSALTWPLCPEIINYEFDTKDLVCLGLSSVVGVWYLLRKVSSQPA